MKKIFFLLGLLVFINSLAQADLHFLETKIIRSQSGQEKQEREYWLRKNLLRIELKGGSWIYFYNLHTNCLALLNQEKKEFYFLDWRELNKKLREINRAKEKILSGDEKEQIEKYRNLLDPFGIDEIFWCSGAIRLGKKNVFKKINGLKAQKAILFCKDEQVAEIWINDEIGKIEEWVYFVQNLRWFAPARARMFSLLKGFPLLISGRDGLIEYQFRFISKEKIPLEVFLLPEDAHPAQSSSNLR